MKKSIKEKLKNSEQVFGSWMHTSSVDIAELMAQYSFDFITLDTEHSLFTADQLVNCIRAIQQNGTEPFVRLKDHSPINARHALEAGATGIIIPMIETLEQLTTIIENCLYCPDGKRGVGYSRANLFGKNFNQYFNEINNKLTFVAQIESKKGMDNIEEILSHPFLDAIMVGPYDLTSSLGIPGQFSNSIYINAVKSMKEAALKSNKQFGTHIVHAIPSEIKKRAQDGYRFLVYSSDVVMLQNSLSKASQEFRVD